MAVTTWQQPCGKNLMAISAGHELGLPTPMVTMTQNDNSPELLAHARRPPCAQPSGEELFEHLLTRRAPSDRRADANQDPVAATLSFGSRNHAQTVEFLRRYEPTPFGVCIDALGRTVE